MSIRNAIERNSEALTAAMAGDVPAVLAILNAATITRTNSTMIGPAGLGIAFAGSPQTAATACGVFEAAADDNPLLKALYNTFCSAGFDFSHEKTRDMIDILFTGELAAVGTALKALGVWQVSPAHEAIGRDATEADVRAAISSLAFDRAYAAAQAAAESLRGQDLTSEAAAIAALKTAVGAL